MVFFLICCVCKNNFADRVEALQKKSLFENRKGSCDNCIEQYTVLFYTAALGIFSFGKEMNFALILYLLIIF